MGHRGASPLPDCWYSMNRDDLSLEQLAQVLDVPADMAALMMRGTIRKGRPMPEAPQRYRVEEGHEVVPIDGRYAGLRRLTVYGDGQKVHERAATLALYDAEAQ